MAIPCVSISVDGNEAKTRARDLNVLLSTSFSYSFHIHSEYSKDLMQYRSGPIKKLFPPNKCERALPSTCSIERKVISKSEDYINIF